MGLADRLARLERAAADRPNWSVCQTCGNFCDLTIDLTGTAAVCPNRAARMEHFADQRAAFSKRTGRPTFVELPPPF